MSNTQWRRARVGADSDILSMRITPEEADRLEQLRRQLGHKSKAQLVRAALDLAEAVLMPGTLIVEGREGLRENEEMFDRLRARLLDGPVDQRDQADRGSGGNSPS